jgi:hypothetical protein
MAVPFVAGGIIRLSEKQLLRLLATHGDEMAEAFLIRAIREGTLTVEVMEKLVVRTAHDAGEDAARALRTHLDQIAERAARSSMTIVLAIPQAEIDAIGASISRQSQLRHIQGTPEWSKRGAGGYFESAEDAQKVLDAVHSGEATILGRTTNGDLLVRFDGVTGYNNNVRAGFVNQATNVFIVKGTAKVSVVPASPGATAT